jgi:hypothetical protein
MIVGFTGTRRGMSPQQYNAVCRLVDELHPIAAAHHGDCVGADRDFHLLVASRVFGCEIHAHPPDNPSLRARMPADVIHDPRPYLERDADIVDSSDVLIACPFERRERYRGSGTWSTIRFSRRAGKPLVIVYPQGDERRERWIGGTDR